MISRHLHCDYRPYLVKMDKKNILILNLCKICYVCSGNQMSKTTTWCIFTNTFLKRPLFGDQWTNLHFVLNSTKMS